MSREEENVIHLSNPRVTSRKSRIDPELRKKWEQTHEVQKTGETVSTFKRVGNFIVRDGVLNKEVLVGKKSDNNVEEVFVSRNIPIISRRLFDIESGQIYETITFNVNGRPVERTVPATTLTVKRHLLELANDGLGVTENNAKDIIDFIDGDRKSVV